MKTIILTGGGTAGHITPNIALIPKLQQAGYSVHYIGAKNGMEENLIKPLNVPFYSIRAGKLRRYLDLKNLTDTFRVAGGFFDALSLIRKIKPDLIFSKGGFVSTPVVWAAWFCRVPAVIHESDITIGLANKLSIPFAKKVCYTFPEAGKAIADGKGVFTGLPIRESLLQGSALSGRRICGFTENKPVLLVVGGSQGSEFINKTIRALLPELLKTFHVCHICGKGNIDKTKQNIPGYRQYEYVVKEQPDLYAMADIVVTRGGSTSLFEILALKKPNIIIPYSLKASRGDQILNAESFKKQGFSEVLAEDKITPELFLKAVLNAYKNRDIYIDKMENCSFKNGLNNVFKVIDSL